MEELKYSVIKKIVEYTELYEDAKVMKDEKNERLYAENVGKLNEILKILIVP